MSLFNTYQQTDAQVCMTLSGLAYAPDQPYLESLLSQPHAPYATGNNWQLVWYATNQANLMYMVQHQDDPQRYIIAIRGTVWSDLTDIVEDLDVYNTTPWMNGHISNGIFKGIKSLSSLRPGNNGMSLAEYLQYISSNSQGNLNITITGHSLGGALAGAYALLLKTTISNAAVNWSVYTFAAPSVGDQDFVQYFNQVFNQANAQAFRIYSNKDLVPFAFAGLADVMSNDIPVETAEWLKRLLGLTLAFVRSELSTVYVQTGGLNQVICLDNATHPVLPAAPLPPPPVTKLRFYQEWFAYQHGHNTYLALLGTAQLPVFPTLPAYTQAQLTAR
ncbi:lipase family protein [Chitinophaga nivalis]|uniref:Lipase family protein n=1 Tax=Chitinophaga nivalis TaxID=2991709 RepID=A0ABT3IJR0_9BACT|nr:lipase family protein [Chitinophaga nivalis]MCW3466325.1 lipase family protein [Chitinophaga nivalis]MCW3483984.1 lipase family protein [Chitinophaga nivalis]